MTNKNKYNEKKWTYKNYTIFKTITNSGVAD